MRSNKRESIPFPIQIILILLFGVVLSIIAVAIIRERFNPNNKDLIDSVYLVTFAQQDGTIIETKTVHEGKGVTPPEYETEGVFRGWSNPFNAVTSNVETHPMVYQVADENLFCFNSVYAKEGEQFTIQLNLTGAVYISDADLIIEYDPLVMDYVFSNCAECCAVSEAESGKLNVEMRTEYPVDEEIQLAELTFYAKPENVYSTQINLRCMNGTLKTGTKAFPVTVSTINNKIYYLQEVE